MDIQMQTTEQKFAICEWCMDVEGTEAILEAGRLGFDGIQLGDAGGSKNGFPLNDPAVQRAYLDAAQNAGVEFQSLHLFTLVRQGGTQLPAGDPLNDAALESIRKGAEACRDMKIPILQLTSYDSCTIHTHEEAENTAATMQKACKIGRELGIRIAWECVAPVSVLQYVLDAVGPELTLCYDLGNPIKFSTGDPIDDLKILGRKAVDHIHMKDMPPEGAGSWPMGRGRGHLKQTVQHCLDMGFSGWWISENFYCNDPLKDQGTYEELIRSDLSVMKEFVLG